MNYSSCKVLITGAAGGIGKEIMKAFLKLNASVVAVDINTVPLKKYCEQHPTKFSYHCVDLRDINSVSSFCKKLTTTDPDINIFIHCAAINMFRDLFDITLDEFTNTLNVNLISGFTIAQSISRNLVGRQTTYGRIIFISSTRAMMSEPHSESYATSKGGLNSLTHAMALSLSNTKITVNAISPGWIETGDYGTLLPSDHNQHPSGRVGCPQDIVNACLFITNESNDFMNGQNLIIDGGMTKKMIYV